MGSARLGRDYPQDWGREMSQVNDGGVAFPVVEETTNWLGMTLRDYFAAKAMAAMIDGALKGGLFEAVSRIASGKGKTSEEYIASKAYEQADAMLKERSK
jgi:hypothetical protein